MRSAWVSYLLWALGIAEGVSVLTALCIELAGIPWRSAIGDTLFFEGAVLLVIGGLVDMARSVTFTHIRALPQIGGAPPRIRKPGRSVVLLIAGLLLCLQGVLLVRLFPLSGG
jgi:hypothetical protein